MTLSFSVLLRCAVCGKLLGTLRQVSILTNTLNHGSFTQYIYTERNLCFYLVAMSRAANANCVQVDRVSDSPAFYVTAASPACEDAKFVPVFD
jgi:hypothetical protein